MANLTYQFEPFFAYVNMWLQVGKINETEINYELHEFERKQGRSWDKCSKMLCVRSEKMQLIVIKNFRHNSC